MVLTEFREDELFLETIGASETGCYNLTTSGSVSVQMDHRRTTIGIGLKKRMCAGITKSYICPLFTFALMLCFDRRVFIYLFICMRVIRVTKKVVNRIA